MSGQRGEQTVRVLYVGQRATSAAEPLREADGTTVVAALSPAEATSWVGEVDCVVVGGRSGEDTAELVERIDERRPTVPVVVDAREGSERSATAAFRAGATDYVPASADATELLDRVEAAVGDRDSTPDQELRRYRQVLEAIQGMVYALDGDGEFVVVTQPLADLFGYDSEELVGRGADEVFDEGLVEQTHRTADRLHGSDRESGAFESEVTTADGERIPVEVELSVLEDGQFRGTVGVVYDRSELAAIRNRLERQRHRFTYLFETLPDPITESEFVDGEPVLRSVNAAFRETFCGDQREVVGRSVNEFVLPPDDEAETEGKRIDQQIDAGESVTAEVRRETVAGPRDFLFRGIPYLGPEDEGGPRAFGIYTDITEQKRYERRLEVLHRVLRHNLRNRTTAIQGYARRIGAAVDDQELQEAVDKLRENSEALGSLNEKAQAIERAATPAVGDEGPVDAADVARTVADGYDGRSGLTVETDLPGECRVAADDRLATAIENLVQNGLEHGDVVEISIRDSDRGEEWVAIQVQDDGPGIPEHERAVVGGERDITQLEHGSGLGLWLVRWVVDAVGGEIEFEEPEAGGSRVVMHLRRANGAA